MQFASLIVDSNEELREIMLSVMSKLTTIHTFNFGVKCFDSMRDFMRADAHLHDLVCHFVDINIIKRLNMLPAKDIPVGLLDSLRALVEDPNLDDKDMMTPLFTDFFPMWLSEIKE